MSEGLFALLFQYSKQTSFFQPQRDEADVRTPSRPFPHCESENASRINAAAKFKNAFNAG